MAKKIDVWKYNFAQNDRVREKVREIFIPKIRQVRDNRRVQEDEWMRFYNMWNVQHDDNHQYNGRAKLYIPEVRKNVEAQARQLVSLAFPSDDFFTCYPGAAGTTKGADCHQALRKWQIEQSKLISKFHVFARQECMYGTSPAYVCWSKKIEHAFQSARDPKTGKIKVSRKLVELYNGPEFIVRDLFKWYTLNPKKFDFQDDGTLEFVPTDRFDILQADKAGLVYDMEGIIQGNSNAYLREEMEKDIERAETLGLQIQDEQGYAGAASLREDDKDHSGTHVKAVIYTKIACEEAALEDEDPELGIPMKIEIYDGEHVGFVGRNPFFHQRAPYLVGRYILPNADEFYGQGIPKATQYQQYEINSKAEQCMDSVTLSLNPITFMDPALAAQNGQYEVEPGAIWFVNPNAAKMSAIPDVSGVGYTAIAQLRSQIQDYSDRAPSMPSQLMGKARSATQADMVDKSMSIDFETFQRQNEDDVLEPLMAMWESLTDQNADDEQIIMILGRDSQDWKRSLISKQDLIGDYKYFWKAASDLDNKNIKARQIIDAMKVAGSLPPDQQGKLNFDYAEAYRVLFRDIWRIPHADKIIPDPMALEEQDPELVIRMLKMGMEVEVLPSDNNQEFIQLYSEAFKTEKDPAIKQEMAKQILMHSEMLDKKKQIFQQLVEQKQQQIQQQQQMMQLAAQRGKPPQAGGQAPQGGGLRGPGDRTQLSPNLNAGDMASGIRA